jgi:hypothetical protein
MIDSEGSKPLRAGDLLEDLCRVCKTVRNHTVIVSDPAGKVLRVICDYCGSQHNYRGGTLPGRENAAPAGSAESRDRTGVSRERISIVTERERSGSMTTLTMPEGSAIDLETLLRRIIREETGLTPVPMADKWHDGEMILRPGRPELQEKSWPIETFFHKVVMLRNRLRVLEQQINGADIPEDLKVKLQGYITGCYGTLTSFNILFADEEDRFHGTG